jgi:hypothetical protein
LVKVSTLMGDCLKEFEMQYDFEDRRSMIEDGKFQFPICRPLISDF